MKYTELADVAPKPPLGLWFAEGREDFIVCTCVAFRLIAMVNEHNYLAEACGPKAEDDDEMVCYAHAVVSMEKVRSVLLWPSALLAQEAYTDAAHAKFHAERGTPNRGRLSQLARGNREEA